MDREYFVGPKGGVYYVSPASGTKVYIRDPPSHVVSQIRDRPKSPLYTGTYSRDINFPFQVTPQYEGIDARWSWGLAGGLTGELFNRSLNPEIRYNIPRVGLKVGTQETGNLIPLRESKYSTRRYFG